MDMEAAQTVGRVLTVLAVVVVGAIGGALLNRLWSDPQKDNSKDTPNKLGEEKTIDAHESALVTRLEKKIANRSSDEKPNLADYGIRQEHYDEYKGKSMLNRATPFPPLMIVRIKRYEAALHAFEDSQQNERNLMQDESEITFEGTEIQDQKDWPEHSGAHSVQRLYGRGTAELDSWITEKDNISPEERAERERWAVARRQGFSEREKRRRVEAAEKRQHAEYWHWLSGQGREFEEELAEIYRGRGYNVDLTPQSGDGGVDLILTKGTKRTVVQCKQQRQPVGPAAARELYGAMIHLKADDAILATTSRFTSGVHDFVKGKPITLLDLDDLVAMSIAASWNMVMDGEAETRSELYKGITPKEWRPR